MSKILILANDVTTIYNFRRELLQRLVREKNEVIVSLPVTEKCEAFMKLGCTVVNTTVSRYGTNPVQDFKLFLSYLVLLRKYKPDVVLTYTIKPNVYGSIACRLYKIPCINNVTGLGSKFQRENLIKKLMIFLQKIAYRKSKCVFFQNRENLQYFQDKKIVGTNTRLIPGSGVNLELHRFEAYPSENESIKFIFVSRVRKDKGFDEFLEAIELIKPKYPSVEFHVVGWFEDESYRGVLERLQKQEYLYYHGEQPQEQVHEYIKKCHCSILPSYHEGMANVLLESASAGRPCLASDIPGCREIINDNVTGFLFNVKDVLSLTESIERFILLPYEEKVKMGNMGRFKMEREFDREFVIDAYLEAINTLEAI